MSNFIKFYIVFGATCVLTTFAYFQGLFNLVLSNDVSYLSAVIMTLFFINSIYLGRTAYRIDKYDLSKDSLSVERSFTIIRFISGNFLPLGLVGTLIGLCLMLFGALDSSKDVTDIVNQLKVGCSVAFFSTLSGMVCTLLSQLQLFVIQLNLD